MQRDSRLKVGFTLVELLVVIGIIVLLMTIIVPVLRKARALAGEKVCASNLRQLNFALMMYAGDDDFSRYPLEPTEHNPHLGLLTTCTGVLSKTSTSGRRRGAIPNSSFRAS